MKLIVRQFMGIRWWYAGPVVSFCSPLLNFSNDSLNKDTPASFMLLGIAWAFAHRASIAERNGRLARLDDSII